MSSHRSIDTTPPPTPRRRPRVRRGSILLMVLVLIVVLSAMILQFTERGLAEMAAEGHYVERDRLRLTAFSALDTTLAVIADVIAIDGGLTAPQQGWDNPLEVAGFEAPEGVTVAVHYFDESGRLPLDALDETTLLGILTQMGVDEEAAFDMTQAFLDWVDEDDNERIGGAESPTYELAEWPHAASNQPVERLSELAVVEGFREVFFDENGRPNDYFRQFEQAVSVWSDGTLNANSVSELTLRAFGIGDVQIGALYRYRAGADGELGTADDRFFASQQEVTAALGELPEIVRLGVSISVLRVQVEVTEKGGGRYALEAVVQPNPSGARSGGSTQNRTSGAGGTGTARSDTGAISAQDVSYPFVLLELTEDVGHNDSISAPAEQTLDSVEPNAGT